MRKLIFRLFALVLVIVLNAGVGVGVVSAASMFDGVPPGVDPLPAAVPAEILLPGLAAFAAFVLSAGGARWLSDALGKSEKFKALSGNAKLVLVFIGCAIVGVLLNEGRTLLAAMPEAVARLDSWLQLVLPLWTFVVSQWRYGGVAITTPPAELPAAGLLQRSLTNAPDGAGWPTYGGG